MELELAEGEQSRKRPRLQLDGQVLQYRAQLKYLGITLSERQLLTQQPVAEQQIRVRIHQAGFGMPARLAITMMTSGVLPALLYGA